MLFWNRRNQESARRVYLPHVHLLLCEHEWTNDKHFYCFLLKPIRYNLVPGFPRALPPWPSFAEDRALGSKMIQPLMIE